MIPSLRLLVLVGFWFYLPVEAFDGDTTVGLDDAVVVEEDCDSFRPSPSSVTPIPHSPAGPPLWRTLPSVTWGVAAPLPPEASGPVNPRVRLLLASRLCARSRITDVTSPPQPQVNSLIESHASSRLSHGSTSRGEGGCVFGEEAHCR